MVSEVIEKSKDEPSDDSSPDISDEAKALKRQIDEDPEDILSIYRLARLHLKNDETSQAFDVLHAGAHRCISLKRYTTAIELFEELLSFRPERTETFKELGKTFLIQDDPDTALERFCEGFEIAIAAEDWSQCQVFIDLVADAEPEGITAPTLRAELADHRGDRDQAIQLLRGVAKKLENEGQRQDFLAVGERILELDPDADDMRIKVGESLVAEAKAFVQYRLYDRAVRALSRAIKYSPEQTETYLTLANLLVDANRRSDAIDLAILAARKITEPESRRELLLFVQQISERPEELEEIAQELGVDLAANNDQSPSWAAMVEEDAALADAETTPSYSLDEVDARPLPIKGTAGPVLNARLSGEICLSLLNLITAEENLRRIIVYEGTQIVAEFLTWRQRLVPGLRIDGRLYGARDSAHDPALIDLYRKLSQRAWATVDGPAPPPDNPLVSSAAKEALTRLHSKALAALCERAADTPLATVIQTLEGPPATRLSFSPASLLLATAPHFCVRPSPALRKKLHQGRKLGHDRWLFGQVSQSRLFFPIGFHGQGPTNLGELLAGAQRAANLYHYQGELAQAAVDAPLLAMSMVTEDAAWGAMIHQKTVLLTRTAQRNVGTMLNQFQRLEIAEDHR